MNLDGLADDGGAATSPICRHPAGASDERADLWEQVRRLQVDRDAWRVKFDRAVRERDAESLKLARVVGSRTYRVALIMRMIIRRPNHALRKALSRVVRKGTAHGNSTSQRTALVDTASTKPSKKAPAKPDGAVVKSLPKPVLSETLPVYVYLASGVDLDTLRTVSRQVGQAALMAGDHAPLIITDNVWFSMLRDTGIAIEYIPDRTTWERHEMVHWDDFYSQRVRQLLELHQPSRVFFIGDPQTARLAMFLPVGSGA